ncbi:indigoidine synthase A-like protein [Chiua virens]|nr:indigoidine synthase A-like protein [Chiua virens]
MFASGHRRTSISVASLSRLPRSLRFSLSHRSSTYASSIDVHPEVEDALANNRPVVALESTIITHGMPYPTSLEMAQSVERIVRSTGSTPATIGLIEGRVKIGLHPAELIFATGGLGGVHRGGEHTMDVSADLHELSRCPVGLVSAGVKSILDIGRTLEYLETLGVPVISYAESNDFPAFYSRKSGFKSPWSVNDPEIAARILHVQRQLGMSNGALFAVPIPEKHEADGALLQEAVERAIRESVETGLSKSGKEVTPWLLKRVGELTSGKSLESNVALVQNTALVGGQIAMAYSRIEKELENRKNHFFSDSSVGPSSPIPIAVDGSGSAERREATPSGRKASVVVVGCAAVDITSQTDALLGRDQKSTYPGKVSVSLGGVARNIAEATHRIIAGSTRKDAGTLLVAPVGDDEFGKLISTMTDSIGMRTDGLVTVKSRQSAVCNLLLDSQGELQCGVAAMDLLHVWEAEQVLSILRDQPPELLAIDGNVSSDLLTTHCNSLLGDGYPNILAPRIFPAITTNFAKSTQSVISFVSPNLLELAQLYQDARNTFDLMSQEHWWSIIDSFELGSEFRSDLAQLAKTKVSDTVSDLGTLSFMADGGIAQMAVNLLPFFQHIVIKCGKLGVLVVMRLDRGEATTAWASQRSNLRDRRIVVHSNSDAIVIIQHFAPLQITTDAPLNSTGAGDSLVGALLATLARDPHAFHRPSTFLEALDVAQQAAVLTLESPHAVSPLLSSLKPT